MMYILSKDEYDNLQGKIDTLETQNERLRRELSDLQAKYVFDKSGKELATVCEYDFNDKVMPTGLKELVNSGAPEKENKK